MEMKQRKLDPEMIVGCAVVAVLVAVSIIFLYVLYFDLDLRQCDSTKLVSAFSVLSGGIWGILLIRNC